MHSLKLSDKYTDAEVNAIMAFISASVYLSEGVRHEVPA